LSKDLDDEVSTITNATASSKSGSSSRSSKKRAASPLNSEISLDTYLIAPTRKGQVRGGVVKTMVYDKKFLGGKIEIPPSENPNDDGTRFGIVKKVLAEKAMLEDDYLDEHGGTLFDGSLQLFISTNKGQRIIEKIGSSTKTMWECMKRVKKNRLQKEIELVLSFGHKKLNSNTPDFNYRSDYSEHIRSSEIFERSPEKFDDRTTATKRREGKIASNSQETVAEKFTKKLYESVNSHVYQGFTYEHLVAFRKAFL